MQKCWLSFSFLPQADITKCVVNTDPSLRSHWLVAAICNFGHFLKAIFFVLLPERWYLVIKRSSIFFSVTVTEMTFLRNGKPFFSSCLIPSIFCTLRFALICSQGWATEELATQFIVYKLCHILMYQKHKEADLELCKEENCILNFLYFPVVIFTVLFILDSKLLVNDC